MSTLNKEDKAVPEHPLDEEKKEQSSDVERIYSEKDKEYLSMLQQRLMDSKLTKNTSHPEFDDKNYYQIYDENEKIANTNHIGDQRNKDDVVVSAGTVEQKLDSLLSNINNLNIESEVFAFDKNNNKIDEAGFALEDIIHDTKILDRADGGGDADKRKERQRELLKQGTVFVQEEWARIFETKKKLTKKYDGEFKDFGKNNGWMENLEKVFEGPSRTMLHGPNVFLGDVTQFYMEDQPYIFTVMHKSYEVARAKYGKFENWNYIKKGEIPSDLAPEVNQSIYDNKWRLTNIKKNQVEIILYQDKPRDEFQIIINGVLMLPIGFPLSAVSPGGHYNIAKQILRTINEKWAYGKSFVSSGSVKEISKILDEMLKLFILKTRKSFTPAYVNTSGRVIDRKVLSPGRISMGIDPGALQPIASNETQGVTAGEVAIFDKMKNLIDTSTVSEQFTGQVSTKGKTATEVIEVQRQSRLTLGLIVAACTLLEKKLDYLRLWNIIENWFEPIGEKVVGLGEARRMVKEFRSANREANIEGEGPGERKIILQEEEPLPSAEVIREMELEEEKEKGSPVRKIFLAVKEFKAARLLWYIVSTSKEDESTPFLKLLFREQLNDMLTLMNLGAVPNLEGLQDEFARVWNKPKNKLFKSRNISSELAGVSAPDNIRTPEQQAQAQGRSDSGNIPIDAGAGGVGGDQQ